MATETVYRNTKHLGSDAAALALDQQDPRKAVELLEQGRGILLSQMEYLRSPMDNLRGVDAEMANEFGTVSSQLEALIIKPSKDYREHDVGR